MNQEEAIALAEEVGLTYADEGTQWRRRVGRGRGFIYQEPDGTPVDDQARAWVETLAIPPAWKSVRIARRADTHIVATGHDSQGRKQYIYHPQWEEIREEVKFGRMWEFGRRIGRLRKRMDSDLRHPGLPHPKVMALAVAVLDRTLIRIGNRRSAAESDAYGLTTLTADHVRVNGSHVHIEFVGKGGADNDVAFEDRRLAALIAQCGELSGQSLFSYTAGDTISSIGSGDVNGYLAAAMGGRFTAKDFRTWGATTTAAQELADDDGDSDPEEVVLAAMDKTAERLGNSRDVCRVSYVHPTVIDAFHDGRLQEAWRRSRAGVWLQRAESAVVKLGADVPAHSR
ncbi:MAG: DNA topoisomerase IB [Acidimicrobiia bacterium]